MMALAYSGGDLAAVGVAASLLHVLNHAVFKGLLFLGAGSVVMATGTRQIEQFGGLLRRMPWTAPASWWARWPSPGCPSLNGFVSEWLTFQALLLGLRVRRSGWSRLIFPLGGAAAGADDARWPPRAS